MNFNYSAIWFRPEINLRATFTTPAAPALAGGAREAGSNRTKSASAGAVYKPGDSSPGGAKGKVPMAEQLK